MSRLLLRKRMPMLGATYHYRYGYPWRWAILTEIAWRIEHLPWGFEGEPLAPLARWGYVKRHQFQRRGIAA